MSETSLFKNFDWENGEFTTDQKAYLKQFAEDWTERVLSTNPVDEEAADNYLKAAYRKAKLTPPKEIIWVDSPLGLVKVGASVGASVGDSVWASVRASVGASVGDSVWASVGASVGDSVWASVRASVGDSVRASVRAYYDAEYSAYLDFYNQHLKANDFGPFARFNEMVSGYFLGKDKAIVVRRPKRLVRDDSGVLHYDQGKAIEYQDGYGFYYLRGVEFKEELYWRIVEKAITAEEVIQIQPIEQRMAAIAMLKPDELLKQLKGELVHTGQKGTKLYEVKNFMDTGNTEYAMLMVCPSTGREYIEWTPPEVGAKKDADLCQAEALGVALEDYLVMEEA